VFSFTAAQADPPIPPLTGRVMDLAQMLDQAEKDRITAELANFEKQKQLQLVVVTLPDLAGYTIEDWGWPWAAPGPSDRRARTMA
jgi:Beta-propeller domains of methanol dehydrogenase type